MIQNLTDYNFDSSKNVWIKKDADPFQYSDGDKVETAIGEILSTIKDKSVYSDELKSVQTDWPTLYYFSANRANLLRPLSKAINKNSRILELGCGMGAITRYLGETAREVYAVEGSLRRGSIAALRCEDLGNVHVIIDEIKALPESLGKFDIVTLIGVLEYACRYGGSGAEMEVLNKARSFLKPDGILILAIENKLGLKYFGGVPEDHIPRSWLGITNGYVENGVQTWSRKELLNMLHKAGFRYCEQFIALPDYKLPTTVITPEGIKNDTEINLGPILGITRRHFESLPVFNMGEAWESAYKAGLYTDLADSLCFVASLTDKPASHFEADELVNHYGDLSSLPKKYAKEVKIKKYGSKIYVNRTKVFDNPVSENGDFYQIVKDEPYYEGELLFSKIRKIAMRPNWTPEEFFKAFDPWVEILRKNADEQWQCDGHLLDLTPFNIVMDGENIKIFDQEWVSRKKLSFVHLLYRGFMNTLIRMMPLRKSSKHNIQTALELFSEFVKRLNLPPSLPVSADYLWWQETKFFKFIKENPGYLPPKNFKIIYS